MSANIHSLLLSLIYIIVNEAAFTMFNILCYHTYVVGNGSLVVHNEYNTKEKGVYELDFDDGTKYIGKGSKQRMQQSIKKWASDGSRNLVSKQFTTYSNDAAAFVMEHIKMVESGFDQVGCTLLNSINSPGKKLIMPLL